MTEFFAMGGYAWYVWMSYGAAAAAIAVEIAVVRARRKRSFDELRMSLQSPSSSPSMLGARGTR